MLARAFLLIALLGISPHPSARAQQPAPAPAAAPVDYETLDLQGLFDKAGELMESANWEEALIPLNLLVKNYGKDAMTDHGPTFGVMYYRRGFCLKNLKRFDEALANYETCYKQFPNTPSTPSGNTNPVFELARLEMGIIKLATGKYEDALVDFEAFAAAPAPAGTYDDTAFRIQAAACYTKAGKTERGHQLIEQLFQPTTPGATTPRPDALMRALLTLVDDWTSSASPDAEKEAHQFIDKYGTQFSVPAFDMKRFEFNNRIVALARKASDKNQTSLAIRLIGLMASPSDILDDLQTRAQRTAPNVPEALQKEITNATAQLTDPDNLHSIAQLSLAGAYERSGNPAAAFAIYQRCLEQVPASPHRDLILFGAMRAALALGHMEFAQSLGDAFRKEFASSQYATNVNTMQLESLYFTQRYQEALDLAMRAQQIRVTPSLTLMLAEEHEAQLLNYLRATPYEVGLLLNFGHKPGFKRRVYDNTRKATATWLQNP